MRSLKLIEVVLQIREEYEVNLEIIHKANFSEFLRNYFVYIQKAGPPKQTKRTPCVHFKRATSYKINVKNVTHVAKIQKIQVLFRAFMLHTQLRVFFFSYPGNTR